MKHFITNNCGTLLAMHLIYYVHTVWGACGILNDNLKIKTEKTGSDTTEMY